MRADSKQTSNLEQNSSWFSLCQTQTLQYNAKKEVRGSKSIFLISKKKFVSQRATTNYQGLGVATQQLVTSMTLILWSLITLQSHPLEMPSRY